MIDESSSGEPSCGFFFCLGLEERRSPQATSTPTQIDYEDYGNEYGDDYGDEEDEDEEYGEGYELIHPLQPVSGDDTLGIVCSICIRESFADAVKTQCGHVYCRGCIENWLINKNICPNCRTVLKQLVE